ncbi:hypothetical protein ACN2MM_03135 [Alkalilimnicola ehrlichii MLHE-1]|uniref:Uncharacterized protein n=1 Tax=Alkalilimnicola ehrlichii (strain ATCC BAA-1101 / DSM 17681 / MLHE-1) TaxID=187272 RepID=Q0ABC6_ALKEH|nr:hypothetical protein [Alkalilimnicola ehrlichii]ABI55861.1 hypothetical protein Mlg_0507 [Alkalilimnicola ehrlichii MLHE-1]
MGFLKIGEKDRTGRQKRIEHTGRYLRASRTGGISLRAHTRVAGVNLTGNTRRGVRVSTRLAKNTQVALQNGRFILRGRYGSDAARINLSKSGVSVSTKTPVGAFNWVRPGRSSFKLGGVHVRGHKAAHLQGVYLLFAGLVALVGGLFKAVAALLGGILGGVQALVAWRERVRGERERLGLSAGEVAGVGEQIVRAQGVALDQEPQRDLFAGLLFVVTTLGRGRTVFDADAVGLQGADRGAGRALATDAAVAGQQLVRWLGEREADRSPRRILGLLHQLALAFRARAPQSARAEALLALDDACLAAGPRTILQEEMIDLLAEALGVDLVLEGER